MGATDLACALCSLARFAMVCRRKTEEKLWRFVFVRSEKLPRRCGDQLRPRTATARRHKYPHSLVFLL